MVCHGRDRRRAGYARLVAGLLLLAAVLAAPPALRAQEELDFTVEPSRIAAGDRFSLVIRASDLPVSDLTIEEPDYPERITKLSGASIVEDGQSGFPGLERRRVEIEIPFRAESAGRVILDPIQVSDRQGNTWQTERRLIEIGLSSGDSRVPFDAAWHMPTETVYEGQTVPVYLEIENATSFSFPGAIDVEPPTGAVFEEVQGLGSVASEVVSGVELLRYPVATFLMTPSAPGELRIPSAMVGRGDLARRAEAREVVVQPLPEDVRSTLAVGAYGFSVEISDTLLTEGDTAELTMRAEGTGNLDFFRFPEVDAGEATVGSIGEQSEVSPVASGLVGSRELRLRVAPEEPGEHEIVVERFYWLEPATGRVRSQGPHRFTLDVRAAEATVAQTRESTPFDALSVAEIQRVQPVEMYRIPAFYLLFLPPFLVIVLAAAGVATRRTGIVSLLIVPVAVVIIAATPARDLPEEELEQAVAALDEGRLDEAIWLLTTLQEEYPRSPGILYNLGYAAYLADEQGRSVFALREALRIRPMFDDARGGLAWVEEQYGLDRQVEVKARMHPDAALVALFVLAYVLAGLVFGLKRRGDARHAIGFISTVLLMIAAAVLMVYAVHGVTRPTAVVQEREAALKQVPVAEAQQWLSLPAGTAVEPRDQYGVYRLIRTGFGVEGWMEEQMLLVSER
ncbi:MAG: tetratricopeptide repeat protein [Spirochaetota bacterium]